MIAIRRLRPDEWQDFRRVRFAALATDPGAFIRTGAEEEARPEAHWREMVDSEDGVIFGLFDGPTLIGITAVYINLAIPARDTAALAMTWIDPAYRGRGLSRLMFEHRLAWARERRVARVEVCHRDGNEPSRRAILAHGFRLVSRTPQHWPDGVDRDNLCYELPIGQST